MKFDSMLEYQKIDSELVKIERELNNSTEKEKASALNAKIKTAGDNMAKFQSEADELNLNAEKLAANVGKYESEVKEIADSISDVQDEQEIEYYEKVLAGLSEDVNKLLRELQRVSARIDQVKDNSDNLTRQAVQLNEQYKVALQSYQGLKLKLQNEEKHRSEIHSDVQAVQGGKKTPGIRGIRRRRKLLLRNEPSQRLHRKTERRRRLC